MDGLNFPDRRPHTGLKEYKTLFVRRGRLFQRTENQFIFAIHWTSLILQIIWMLPGKRPATVRSFRPACWRCLQSLRMKQCLSQIHVPARCRQANVTCAWYTAKKETSWRPAGFELGFDQMKLPSAPQGIFPLFRTKAAQGSLSCTEYKKYFILRGKMPPVHSYINTKEARAFANIVTGGKERFKKPMEYNVFVR